MIKKIKQLLFVAMASSSLFTFGLVPALATTASADNIINSVCTGTNNATGNQVSNSGTNCGTAGTGGANDSIKTLAARIVSIFSIIVGVIAVIMIIYGGFRYITSGGDSGKVGNAKNSLIYAIIGLIIVALAQFIVHYVLNTAGSVTSTTA